MCKRAGDWTTKLFVLAQTGKDGEPASDTGRRVTVLVDGPYGARTCYVPLRTCRHVANDSPGGPGHAVISSFSGAIIVAGGSGITYALSTVEDLLHSHAASAGRARVIELVWSVQNPCRNNFRFHPAVVVLTVHSRDCTAALFPMVPLFSRLLDRARSTGVSLQISVFYTRAQAETPTQALQVLPSGLSLTPGRPHLERLLTGVVDRTSEVCVASQEQLSGILVGACGPVSLTEKAGDVVRSFDRKKFKAVGGIELQEECVISLSY